MNTKGVALLVLFLLSIAFGCSSEPVKDPTVLTRDHASELIAKHEQFQTPYRPKFRISASTKKRDQGPGTEKWRQGVNNGLWNAPSERWTNDDAFKLTERGEQLFELGYINHVHQFVDLTIREGLQREIIEITGIADIPMMTGMKEVEFTWRFLDIPDAVKDHETVEDVEYYQKVHEGSATLRLYDDGWRIEDKLVGSLL